MNTVSFDSTGKPTGAASGSAQEVDDVHIVVDVIPLDLFKLKSDLTPQWLVVPANASGVLTRTS